MQRVALVVVVLLLSACAAPQRRVPAGPHPVPLASAPAAQKRDVAGVLSAALSQLFGPLGKKQVVVQGVLFEEEARRMDEIGKAYRAELPSLRNDTVLDYLAREGRLEALPDGIGGAFDVTRWTTARIERQFREDLEAGWAALHEEFPDCLGIVEFSPVGFSSDRTQALVCVEHRWHEMGGEGHLVLLELVHGAWHVIAKSEVWTA